MSLELQHDTGAGKYFVLVDGHEAHVTYQKTGTTYDLQHTFVPEELRGRGIASQLVRAVLDDIKAQGATFIPTCPFIQAFVSRNPQ